MKDDLEDHGIPEEEDEDEEEEEEEELEMHPYVKKLVETNETFIKYPVTNSLVINILFWLLKI